jgi:hypothetical protein
MPLAWMNTRFNLWRKLNDEVALYNSRNYTLVPDLCLKTRAQAKESINTQGVGS